MVLQAQERLHQSRRGTKGRAKGRGDDERSESGLWRPCPRIIAGETEIFT